MDNYHRVTLIVDNDGTLKEFSFSVSSDLKTPYEFIVLHHEFTFRDGMVFYNNKHPVYAIVDRLTPEEQWYTELEGGDRAILRVERIINAGKHPGGHTCGRCAWFDAAAGRAELERQTHTYANGSYGFTNIVVQYAARQMKSIGLSPATAGWCAAKEWLVDKRSPACLDNFKKTPGFLARLFGRK